MREGGEREGDIFLLHTVTIEEETKFHNLSAEIEDYIHLSIL